MTKKNKIIIASIAIVLALMLTVTFYINSSELRTSVVTMENKNGDQIKFVGTMHFGSDSYWENVSKEFENEIQKSKTLLENRVGYRIDHFSYPAGDFDDATIEYVKQFGYLSAVSIMPGLNDFDTDPYKLRRIGVREDFLSFKARTSGSYIFLSRLFNLFKDVIKKAFFIM